MNEEDAEGVILNCIDEMSCYGSKLVCPSDEYSNTTCIVRCYSELSCSNMVVIAYDVRVECVAYHACKGISIQVYHEGSTTNVICNGNKSCVNAIFYLYEVDNFGLQCNGDDLSCGNVNVTAYNVADVRIDCMGNYSCKGLELYHEEGFLNSISCYNGESCMNAIFEIHNVDIFGLTCEGEGLSCSNVSITVPNQDTYNDTNFATNGSSEIIIDCKDDNVCSGMQLNTGKYALLTVNCNKES